ncbi:MAG TPA: protein-ADP-ribose hydrolase [Chloroflexota bacterium]|nr:protein-ADP-ribose hydrolase [Chloroflexota bacterium]
MSRQHEHEGPEADRGYRLLRLDDYRELVSLDALFKAGSPISPESRNRVVDDLLETLAPEGASRRLGLRPEAIERLKRDPEQARRLLRAFLTVRGPEPLLESFNLMLDGLLQLELQERGQVELPSLTRIRDLLPESSYPALPYCALWRGDITRLSVDAIVNAANSRMLGCFVPFHACIDNAIHSTAGPRLREDCDRIMRLQGGPEPTGGAKATRGYNLPARFVLHTVGPIVEKELTEAHEKALASCYISCLDLASRLPDVHSVAFCAISTGVFGYPKLPAALVALQTVSEWLRAHPGSLDLVVFNVFGDEDLAVYQVALEKWDSASCVRRTKQ